MKTAIPQRWVVFCPAGPEAHGLYATKRAADRARRMLNEDEPTHKHRVIPWYGWVPQ
jgi:hypothetical protein